MNSSARKVLFRLTLNGSWRVALLLANLSLVSARSEAQATLWLTEQNCPVCSSEQRVAIINSIYQSMGVNGRDVLGDAIGTLSSWDLGADGPKSAPLSPGKETLCGILRQVRNFWNNTDQDWALNIEPSQYYLPMLLAANDAGYPSVFGKGHVCMGAGCVHAEIRPEWDFPTNDFFRVPYGGLPNEADVEMGESTLIGWPVCVYGPWVGDVGHSGEVEIHPAELVWFQTNSELPRPSPLLLGERLPTYHLMMLQDISARYESSANFPCDSYSGNVLNIECADPPRPWAEAPRRTEFRLMFSVPTGHIQTYLISERYSRDVRTAEDNDAKQDQGPGTEYAIMFNGTLMFKVRELQPDDHLGVRFDKLCYIRSKSRRGPLNGPPILYGQLVLNSKYGHGGGVTGGYQVLDIDRSDYDLKNGIPVVSITAVNSATLAFRSRQEKAFASPPIFRLAIPGPLHRAGSDIVGDIAARIDQAGNPPVLLKAARLTAGKLAYDVIPKVVPTDAYSASPTTTIVPAVPLLHGAMLTLRFAKGQSTVLRMPKLALHLSVDSAAVLHPQRATEAWRALAKEVGRFSAGATVPVKVMRSSNWTVDLSPHYGLSSSDEAGDNLVTSALNRALDSLRKTRAQASGVSELYGSPTPFNISWTFQAKDVTTGHAVATRVGKRNAPTDIEVDTISKGPENFRLVVRFPDSGDRIYKLEANATIKDSYGIHGRFSYAVWSHYVEPDHDEKNTPSLGTLARLADIDSTALETLPVRGETSMPGAYAKQARASFIQDSRDGRLTVPELRQLLRLASRLANAVKARQSAK